MSDIYQPPTEAWVRLRDGNLVPPMPLELEHRIGMLNHRYRQILDRASELGAERYQLRIHAKNDPSRWQRLAAIEPVTRGRSVGSFRSVLEKVPDAAASPWEQ